MASGLWSLTRAMVRAESDSVGRRLPNAADALGARCDLTGESVHGE